MSDHVVIVGGGLTGLVTAHHLRERGIPSVLLEAADHLGGRVGTDEFPDGATAERGMGGFWETSPAYALVRRLGLPVVERPAHSSVILGGRLHAYQVAGGSECFLDDIFDGAQRCALSRWGELAEGILDELAVARSTGCWSERLAALRRTSFASFIFDLGLPPRVRSWIRIVVESEIAVEWHRIAALDGVEEMRPFLPGRSAHDASRNVRLAGGNERLIEALASGLPADSIRLGARVRRVTDDDLGNGVEVAYEDAGGRQYIERGHHAVLTPPVWALREIDQRPLLDPMSREAMELSAAGSYVKVVLRLRPERVTLWEGDGGHPFTLLSDGPAGCVCLSDGRVSGHDHVLTMLIHGEFARALNGRGSEEIVARSVSALERLVVRPSHRQLHVPLLRGVSAAVTEARVYDYPRAVAYWPHALGRSRFDRLSDALRAPHGRVLIGGDTTDSSHSNGAVIAGQRMASLIIERVGERSNGQPPAAQSGGVCSSHHTALAPL